MESASEKMIDKYVRAVVRVLRSRGLPGTGSPSMDVTELGRGSFGFVLRGYIHIYGAEVRERVKWLVVKGPLPRMADDFGTLVSASTLEDRARVIPFVGAQKPYFVDTTALDEEYDKRVRIGAIPGLGAVPQRMVLDRAHVQRELGGASAAAFELPPEIVLLVDPRMQAWFLALEVLSALRENDRVDAALQEGRCGGL